jgi:hypothetical protein
MLYSVSSKYIVVIAWNVFGIIKCETSTTPRLFFGMYHWLPWCSLLDCLLPHRTTRRRNSRRRTHSAIQFVDKPYTTGFHPPRTFTWNWNSKWRSRSNTNIAWRKMTKMRMNNNPGDVHVCMKMKCKSGWRCRTWQFNTDSKRTRSLVVDYCYEAKSPRNNMTRYCKMTWTMPLKSSTTMLLPDIVMSNYNGFLHIYVSSCSSYFSEIAQLLLQRLTIWLAHQGGWAVSIDH